ncbi:acylneuraminate cytidylyltransferase family protein [Candidatus Methylomirabilis sp.]|uniref:acylneuraminate cytidylyltransferase family protein n=1 Tax=Candidatus Methylomirabilis sp. TaxID=2032687 RepID=UPI002A665B98|nr:acylneuraminate cytidylyltransferase family protein [Candidatus Methylomirabilis sp.]
MSRNVAIIPARGGSQSIPDKNIREFSGKPLIAWTIEKARETKGIDRIIVSTDSERIATVARNYGAETPFLRPASLSTAEMAIEPVLKHAYEWLLANEGYQAETLVLLFPTNPLRETRHIEESLRLFQETVADSVITVNESPAHYTPYWTIVRGADGRARYFGGGDMRTGYTRRQDFPERCFAKNDLIFVLRPQNLFGDLPSLYGRRTELLVTDRIYDGDINTREDWDLTLLTFRYLTSLKAPAHS